MVGSLLHFSWNLFAYRLSKCYWIVSVLNRRNALEYKSEKNDTKPKKGVKLTDSEFTRILQSQHIMQPLLKTFCYIRDLDLTWSCCAPKLFLPWNFTKETNKFSWLSTCRQCFTILLQKMSRYCSIYSTLEEEVCWSTPAQIFQAPDFCSACSDGSIQTPQNHYMYQTTAKILIPYVKPRSFKKVMGIFQSPKSIKLSPKPFDESHKLSPPKPFDEIQPNFVYELKSCKDTVMPRFDVYRNADLSIGLFSVPFRHTVKAKTCFLFIGKNRHMQPFNALCWGQLSIGVN